MKIQSTITPLLSFIAVILIAGSVSSNKQAIYISLKAINPIYLFAGVTIIIFSCLSIFLLKRDLKTKALEQQEKFTKLVLIKRDMEHVEIENELETVA